MNADPFEGPDPDRPSFAPLVDHPGLRSDTPIIADMLMDPDGPWRSLAEFILPHVTVRLTSQPAGLLPRRRPTTTALEPSRVFGPEKPAWVKMRDDWMARRREEETS